MGFLNTPIGWIISLCYKLIPNYALALLIFTLIMKLLLFPFGIKQQKNMLRQAKLRPKEQAIRKRYAGRDDKVTQQKIQEEVMKLYQEENYNPAAGCLPMILQLVIIFALYGVIQRPLTYVTDYAKDDIKEIGVAVVQLYNEYPDDFDASGLPKGYVDKFIKPQAEKAVETEDEEGNKQYDYSKVGNPLSGNNEVNLVRVVRDNYDILAEKGFLPENVSMKTLPDFTIFGGKFDLSSTPSTGSFNWLWLIPLLTFLFTFGSMKINKKLMYQPPTAQSADMGCSMKIMDYMMPLMSTFITFSVPAIIAVYWIYNNIFSTIQQLVLKLMYPIPVFTEEDYKRAEKEMNKGIKAPKKKASGTKHAAHRIDLDDAPVNEEPKQTSTPKKNNPASTLIAPASVKDESDKEND